MPPTSWPPVWPRGHNPFTPAVGKYFLPDSTDQTELSGADWLWTPVAESDRETWCEKLDKKRIERKHKLAGGFMCARGEGRLGHIRPLKTSRLRGNSTTAQGSGRTHTTCAMGVGGLGGGLDIWDCLNKSGKNISHQGPCGRCCWFVPLLQRHLSPLERQFYHC